jgi:hypothetical protein
VTLLRTLARQLERREILRALNDELAAQNPRAMFVTMACLDVRGGAVTCANAGHDARCSVARPARPAGVPLVRHGARPLPGPVVHERDLELADGDSLVLYTDGVTEAANAANELFGDERLQACFAGAGATAADAVERLLREVRGSPAARRSPTTSPSSSCARKEAAHEPRRALGAERRRRAREHRPAGRPAEAATIAPWWRRTASRP